MASPAAMANGEESPPAVPAVEAFEWAETGTDDFGKWGEAEIAGVRVRFRWIEPGTFMMGSPDSEEGHYSDENQKEVTIEQGYWMADSEVTQALWVAVMDDNPSAFKGSQRPVERVNWNDAKVFLRKVNQLVPGIDLRLPLESEWEYACRSGTTTSFSFGANITTDEVNYNGNYPYVQGHAKGENREQTVDVKSLSPNPWGLYEMHGNVWEWCEDESDDGPNRVVRGGAWNYSARACRSALRFAYDPSYRGVIVGFRVARGQDEF